MLQLLGLKMVLTELVVSDRVWRLFVQDNGELSEKITDAPNKELEKLTIKQ